MDPGVPSSWPVSAENLKEEPERSVQVNQCNNCLIEDASVKQHVGSCQLAVYGDVQIVVIFDHCGLLFLTVTAMKAVNRTCIRLNSSQQTQ